MSGIALVHWAYPPTVGGVETHLWEFSQRLVESKYRVTVLTGTLEPEDRSIAPPDVEVLRHPGLALTPTADRTGLKSWLSEKLRQRDVAVVHGHNLHHAGAPVARALTELRDDSDLHFRLAHTYHCAWPNDGFLTAWDLLRSWDRHFAVSEYLADRLEDTQRMPRPEVTYLGVGTSRYRAIKERSGEPTTILLPARLDPGKGAKQAITAFADLVRSRPRSSRLRLVLTDSRRQVDYYGTCVGYRRELERLVADQGAVAGQVEFVEAGWADMPGLYERADIVLCPSVYGEPLGLAALEAMCAARPVVSTEVGGLGEAVGKSGDTGLVVPAGDAPALAKAIGLLLDDPDEARAMGLRGRGRVLDEFDLDRTYLPHMLTCYRELGAHPSTDDAPVARQALDDRGTVAADGHADDAVGELEAVHP